MNKYLIKKNYAILIIYGNKINGEVFIDLDDLNKIKEHSWYIKDSLNNCHYVASKINGKTIKLHRFILNENNSKIIIDHINRNTLDNRKNNLRKTNYSNNNLNCKFSKNNKSGRTGVRYVIPKNRSPKWVSQATINKKKFTKDFSVSVYGYQKAKELALKQREKWEKEFNILTEKESSTTIEKIDQEEILNRITE